ncbi:MAG: alpha/beta fold hydrolase [Verrucomicrobia bacterium]|nr:alpha/beta fold hydrolase [Verrucomicrobiota bacterium]
MQDTQWIDRREYPFQPRFFETTAGRVHYVDEGQGRPVVFVHGATAWSFHFRHFIRELSQSHRCVAPDHLGFGLSDPPANGESKPAEHAQHLSQFLASLGLRDITLVLHDFGGPIGLACALENLDNVRQLVLCNTWMWPVNRDPHFERQGKFLSGALGKFLYEKTGFGFGTLARRASGSALPDNIWRQYTGPLATPAARCAARRLAGERLGSGGWLDELSRQKEKLAAKPALLIWGQKDRVLPRKMLQNWTLVFREPQVHTFADAGHFVLDEKAAELTSVVAQFLQQ